MPTIKELIPDVDVLLTMEPAELAGVLLQVMHGTMQNGMWSRDGFAEGLYYPQAVYPPEQKREVLLAIYEATAWLERECLIVRAGGSNATWRVLTRTGAKLTKPEVFKTYRQASLLPKALLHPKIADAVWGLFVRGDHDTAVFQAFKEVEVAVRAAGGYADSDIGVNLMRKAFHPEIGRLTDKEREVGERQAASDLFAGAIGSYKNPQSHRTVGINDPGGAAEMIILASHLLRIIDARRSNTP